MICALVILSSAMLSCSAQSDEGTTAREIVGHMSLREKIAQLMFMDFRKWKTLGEEETIAKLALDPKYDGEPVAEMNGEIQKMLEDYHFGGVILFSENLKNTENSVRLVRDIQRATVSGGGLPSFIGADQEGGVITRLGQGTCLPGNMAIGATGRTDYAFEAGAITGGELDAIGINVNFSPVSDVNDNPENPIINLRSFGSDPAIVSEMAVSMMKGIESEGVVAVGKHFPGHGNTSTDSHTSLPLVEKDLNALRETELKPFQALIDSGVKMLMCAHIQFPKLDSTTFISTADGQPAVIPATFSHAILTDLLRGEMGFQGVLITDAMSMDAIAKHIAPADAVVRALEAGADMICMPVEVRSPEDAALIEEMISTVEAAMQRGELPLSRIDEAATRVVQLKIDTGLLDETFAEADDEAAVRNALEIVGCPAHRETEREIAEAIVRHMPASETLERAEASPPGFINLTLKDGWLAGQVEAILAAGDRYGCIDLGRGKRTQVEFVSVNPTGPLHVGSARNAVLGDALASVLKATGYDVQREYYINDRGTQFENFAATAYVRYAQALGEAAPRAVVIEKGGGRWEGAMADLIADPAARRAWLAL